MKNRFGSEKNRQTHFTLPGTTVESQEVLLCDKHLYMIVYRTARREFRNFRNFHFFGTIFTSEPTKIAYFDQNTKNIDILVQNTAMSR